MHPSQLRGGQDRWRPDGGGRMHGLHDRWLAPAGRL